MTHTYKVTVKARQRGAIGRFYPRVVVVETDSRAHSHEMALQAIEADGYEPLGVVSVEGRMDY